jgi:hypothetical protein
MAQFKSTAELVEQLRSLLREAFALRQQGAAYAAIQRAHGYADGYMRMLMDSGMMDARSLLSLVAEVRREVDGPATREVSRDSAASLVHA